MLLPWLQIKIQAPPIEDIPVELDSRIKDLFRMGWNREVADRWSAQQLLTHRAFRILGLCVVCSGRIHSADLEFMQQIWLIALGGIFWCCWRDIHTA